MRDKIRKKKKLRFFKIDREMEGKLTFINRILQCLAYSKNLCHGWMQFLERSLFSHLLIPRLPAMAYVLAFSVVQHLKEGIST